MDQTRHMTVAQALVHFLAVQYSERDGARRRLIPAGWGIFGHGNVAGLGQALEAYGDALDLPFYRPQNEQAQVHLAAAYARHADRLATLACTASVGPGSTNMLTGAALATVNRLPVLLLPSDYFANRVPDPVLQQVEHPTEHDLSLNDAFRPVARFFTRISRPEQLLHALPEAMRVLTDPAETGAVVISLPEDVQAEAYDWPEAFFAPRTWRIRRPPPDSEALEDAVAAWRRARNPLIVAGGGVRYAGAHEALAAFAERWGVPVAETQAGRGSLPWTHDMAVGPVGTNGGSAANALAREADLILAVGTRLSDFTTSSKTAFGASATVIGLNVAAMDAHKLAALPLIADARVGLEALDGALADAHASPAAEARRDHVASLKESWDAVVDRVRSDLGDENGLAQGGVLGMVNDAFGGDAVVINAAGSMPGDLLRLWRPTDPRAYHVEYGFSCMGYEIPAGLGVRLAEPDPERPVVVLVGDGSYLMMNAEIVTAVGEGLDLTFVVIDNHGFQSIHGLQRSVGSPTFGVELRGRDGGGRPDGPYLPVDFAAHAASMGAHATTARSADQARAALHAARDARGVRVVVIEVDPKKAADFGDTGGWWDVPVAETSTQESVAEARRAYERARERQVIVRAPSEEAS